MQLRLFAEVPRSLTVLVQVLSPNDVERVLDAFAGRTIYIPKRSNRRIAVEFLQVNPQATNEMVMAVCGVSRATVYRARQELRHVQDIQDNLQEGDADSVGRPSDTPDRG